MTTPLNSRLAHQAIPQKHTTLILKTDELYNVIPEAKTLEGANFTDMTDLLRNLITKIEQSGEWEFVQYVSAKPSIFIIRKRVKFEDYVKDTYGEGYHQETPKSDERLMDPPKHRAPVELEAIAYPTMINMIPDTPEDSKLFGKPSKLSWSK